MSNVLRPYQTEAINKLRESFRAGNKRVILSLCVGSGKTHIAVAIIQSALKKKVRLMFAVDRLQLLDQTQAVFLKHGLQAGIIQGDHHVSSWSDLQIASIQTLNRRTVVKPNWLIIDECHTIHKPLMERLHNEWADVNVIGLTATPFTKGLGRHYDDMIMVESTKNLIDNGFLCDFDVYAAPIDMSGVKTRMGDFVKNETEKRVNTSKIVGDVVETWLRLGESRKTICFAVSVAHSKSICDEFRANGISAAHIDAHTDQDDRRKVLKAHEDGRINILVNVGITVAGWNSPDTTCLIFACPTKSLIKHIQILGRVLRVSGCGKKALILDHGGNIERNGFPTDTLPDQLDTGEGNNSEAQVREKKEPDPIACQKCRYVSTEFICPKCGFETEVKPKVEALQGTLKKLKRVSIEEKKEFYAMALGWCRAHNKKPGMAFYLCKEMFGTTPRNTKNIQPQQPDNKFNNWMTHRNIKWAKRRNKGGAIGRNMGEYHNRKRSGFRYTMQATKSGERIRVDDSNGAFICWAPLKYKEFLV